MMDDDDIPLSTLDQKFVTNALEAVKIRFVRNQEEFGSKELKGYAPEFAHQHFGESETIFGYQDLSITINYAATSLYIFPEFKYSRTSTQAGSEIPPIDLYETLQEQLPTGQFHIMMNNKKDFMKELDEQKDFTPFGKLLHTFNSSAITKEVEPAKKRARQTKTFELYKVTESSQEFDLYLARLQTLALWYIDASEYTDTLDDRWMHYILYEVYDDVGENGQICKRYLSAGYSSCFRFYHYPDQDRVRIAHMLLLPPYRNTGIGATFLDIIYRNLWSMNSVYDVTVEDASDNMIFLRDYLDCINCRTLPEFSEKELKNGFSAAMQKKSRENFKIHNKQARRVYEILRYIATNQDDETDVKGFRLDIKRRLEKPFKRRAKDWNNIKNAFDQDTLNQLAATETNPEVKKSQLASLYEETLKGYEVVASRLKKYPTF